MDLSWASAPPNNPGLVWPVRWTPHSGSLISEWMRASRLLGHNSGMCTTLRKNHFVYMDMVDLQELLKECKTSREELQIYEVFSMLASSNLGLDLNQISQTSPLRASISHTWATFLLNISVWNSPTLTWQLSDLWSTVRPLCLRGPAFHRVIGCRDEKVMDGWKKGIELEWKAKRWLERLKKRD